MPVVVVALSLERGGWPVAGWRVVVDRCLKLNNK